MKGSKWFAICIVIVFTALMVMFQSGMALAFNPQPEPPGKQKVNEDPIGTKQGIINNENKQVSPTKQKGLSTPGGTKSGIAIEERGAPVAPASVKGTAK